MDTEIKPTEQAIEDKKPLRLSSSTVLKANTVIVNRDELTEEQFDAFFKDIPDNARFTGGSTSTGLLPDYNKPFNISLPDENNFKLSVKLVEVTSIEEGKNSYTSPVSTNKVAIIAEQEGKKISCNLMVTPENKKAVYQFLKDGKAKAITTHWEGLKNRNGDNIAKVEILTANIIKDAEIENPAKVI